MSRLKILLANIGRLAYYKQVIDGDEDWSHGFLARLINLERNLLKKSRLIPWREKDYQEGKIKLIPKNYI